MYHVTESAKQLLEVLEGYSGYQNEGGLQYAGFNDKT
jgi:hypothetical protein